MSVAGGGLRTQTTLAGIFDGHLKKWSSAAFRVWIKSNWLDPNLAEKMPASVPINAHNWRQRKFFLSEMTQCFENPVIRIVRWFSQHLQCLFNKFFGKIWGKNGANFPNLSIKMAERVGFEPTIELPLYSISNAAPSTTRPSLRFRLRQSNNILRFQEKIKANPEKKSKKMAERGGFEPPVEFDPYDGLANRSFRPLRHLSASVRDMSYTILRFPDKIKAKT